MKKIDLFLNTAYILHGSGNINKLAAYMHILQSYRKNMTILQLIYYADLKILFTALKAKNKLKAFNII